MKVVLYDSLLQIKYTNMTGIHVKNSRVYMYFNYTQWFPIIMVSWGGSRQYYHFHNMWHLNRLEGNPLYS